MSDLPSTLRRLAGISLACVLSALAGCKDQSIATYRVPKETDAQAASRPAASGAEPGAGSQAGPKWVVPDGWKAQPASGMRIGSYQVAGAGGAVADVSVITFPGTGGDDLANINRWRDQLQLPPVTAEALPAQLQGVETAAGPIAVADLTGTPAGKPLTRIIGGWLRQSGHVWFFKIMGPADLVGSQKDAFFAFLKSVTIAEAAGGAPAQADAGSARASTNDVPRGGIAAPSAPAGSPMSAMPVVTASGAALTWKAPADWQSKAGSSVRRGSYSVGGAAAAADVAITAFPGDVGGVLANVNRWRDQVGLAPLDDAGLPGATTALDSNGLHFVIADVAGGTGPGSQRIVAAMAAWQGGTWFFKLAGPGETVGRAKPGFIDFLRTVQPPASP